MLSCSRWCGCLFDIDTAHCRSGISRCGRALHSTVLCRGTTRSYQQEHNYAPLVPTGLVSARRCRLSWYTPRHCDIAFAYGVGKCSCTSLFPTDTRDNGATNSDVAPARRGSSCAALRNAMVSA